MSPINLYQLRLSQAPVICEQPPETREALYAMRSQLRGWEHGRGADRRLPRAALRWTMIYGQGNLRRVLC